MLGDRGWPIRPEITECESTFDIEGLYVSLVKFFTLFGWIPYFLIVNGYAGFARQNVQIFCFCNWINQNIGV